MIESFIKIRQDGKIINEGMNPVEVGSLGPISRVVELKWKFNGSDYSRRNEDGIFAIVVPGRNYIAAMEAVDVTGQSRLLKIISPDNTEKSIINNKQTIDGNIISGLFSWFEPLKPERRDFFGVVFQYSSVNDARLLEVNAASGTIKIIGRVR